MKESPAHALAEALCADLQAVRLNRLNGLRGIQGQTRRSYF